MQFLFGKHYVEYLGKLGESKSTIFLGQDLGDLSSVITKGLGLMQSNVFQSEKVEEDSKAFRPPVHRPSPPPPFSAPNVSAADSSKYAAEIDELNAELEQYGDVTAAQRRH